MSPNQDLFMDFPATSKAEWLAKITKDLKGREISELTWQLPDLVVPPFAHADDLDTLPAPLSAEANAWTIGEDINVVGTDWAAANTLALEGLMGGVAAPRFIADAYPNAAELAVLLKDIELDYIELHFKERSGQTSPLDFLKNIYDFAQKQGKNTAILRGVVYFDPTAAALSPTDLKALSDWTEHHLPAFIYTVVAGEAHFEGSERVVAELTATVEKAQQQLVLWQEAGVSLATIAPKTSLNMAVGVSYFIEIAKLRALKLLWGNVLTSFGHGPILPRVHAFVGVETQVEDPHTNKIRQTTQAMSAVVAGVTALFVAPSDALHNAQGSRQSRRIARNVQHLLQMESYLDKVADVAAGSYYLETLTEKISETVWEKANFTA